MLSAVRELDALVVYYACDRIIAIPEVGALAQPTDLFVHRKGSDGIDRVRAAVRTLLRIRATCKTLALEPMFGASLLTLGGTLFQHGFADFLLSTRFMNGTTSHCENTFDRFLMGYHDKKFRPYDGTILKLVLHVRNRVRPQMDFGLYSDGAPDLKEVPLRTVDLQSACRVAPDLIGILAQHLSSVYHVHLTFYVPVVWLVGHEYTTLISVYVPLETSYAHAVNQCAAFIRVVGLVERRFISDFNRLVASIFQWKDAIDGIHDRFLIYFAMLPDFTTITFEDLNLDKPFRFFSDPMYFANEPIPSPRPHVHQPPKRERVSVILEKKRKGKVGNYHHHHHY